MTLKAVVTEEIRRSGPMPFERFMELALYHPQGFFGGDRLRSEKAGDFLTSPEVSPMFGQTIARFVAAERERIGDPFGVVEVGAGSGSLLRPLLEEVPVPAVAVDVSPAARASLQESLPGVEVRADLPERIRGVVVANELLDNIPMALAQKVGGRWRERWVGLDGDGLCFVDAPVRPEVGEWLDRHAAAVDEGGWVEVQLGAAAWVREVLDRLEAGALLVIDYGGTTEELLPRRADGTLRTYQAHHLGPHPLDFPGETDITADVEFTAIAGVAGEAGAAVELVRQDDFLASLGLRERLSQLRALELEAAREGDAMARLRYRTMKSEAETLLHPRGLGGFMVMIARI
ncbi:MAG: SAM-dependent methyltransferase [Actinomycetes bacterium]|jgi:SAM-dependent MidA family methyltransferase